MLNPIVECVPNFSEARRPEVVAAIQQAIATVSGVHVLDRHSDLDHNRTVITFAGLSQAVEEAAFQAITKAAQLIDLDKHTGEHPRIGATDVVPFVPISGVSMQECVEIAQRLGKRVGEELGIPVYLYEQAATRPERQNLENLRRGQYEGLKQEILTNPERQPDFGPARLGPAGATVIGARPFLIAYNVYLATDEVAIAEKIARAIRHSSGGMRHIKALGLLVDGRAQVSMNFTDFRKTPLARVVELIRREAARHGVAIHHSELVGLIPEAALVEAAVWYLQLDQFEPGQVLESRLREALEQMPEVSSGEKTSEISKDLSSLKNETFLDTLAAGKPTPGGGSAAAYAGAMAAALVAMVAHVTIGKKKYATVEAEMQSILEKAESLRAELNTAVEQDAAAFEEVMSAFNLLKKSPDEQSRLVGAVQVAMLKAAQVPLKVARKSVEVLELSLQVITHGNLNAISDGGSAAALAQAALTGAGLNVRINVANIDDKAVVQPLLDELRSLEENAANLLEKVRTQLIQRGGLSLG